MRNSGASSHRARCGSGNLCATLRRGSAKAVGSPEDTAEQGADAVR